MTFRTLALIAIALWIVTFPLGAVLFFLGYTTPSADGRVAVRLNSAAREFVLTQMRGMLANVQGIVNGLAGNDPGRLVGDYHRLSLQQPDLCRLDPPGRSDNPKQGLFFLRG